MEKGEKFYYSSTETQYSAAHIHTAVFIGETSRSWLVGSPWRPSKLPKKTTIFRTEEQFNEYLWASKNRYRIGQWVNSYATAEQLKQIAAMVGYQEEQNGNNPRA